MSDRNDQEPRKRGDTLQAVVVSVLVSGLLTGILVLQNTQPAQIDFLAWSATIPLSAALLLAAVAGGILGFSVAFARQRQLRRALRPEKRNRRERDEEKGE